MNLQSINEMYPDFAEHIDVKEGMGRIGNNKKLLKMLCGSFLRDTNFQKLCNLFEAGDFTGAASPAHAIKGVAANLSFKKLYAVSAELEKELKEGTGNAELFGQITEVMRLTTFYVGVLSDNIDDI